jgi:hypothetical protein
MAKDFLNSLPDTPSAGEFVGISLDILQVECPPAYDRLCRQLAGQNVRLQIEDEPIDLVFREDQVSIFSPSDDLAPDTSLKTSWQTVLDLADGKMSLDQAVLSNAVAVKGEVATVAHFYDGLHTYLSGAVRCPSFPLLLEHFRRVYDTPRDGEHLWQDNSS